MHYNQYCRDIVTQHRYYVRYSPVLKIKCLTTLLQQLVWIACLGIRSIAHCKHDKSANSLQNPLELTLLQEEFRQMDITSHFGVIQSDFSNVWRKLREITIKVTYHGINCQVLVRSCMVCDFQLAVGVISNLAACWNLDGQ